MISVELYDTQKKPVGKVELPEKLFGGPVRRHLYYDVVKWQMARRRQGSASTKNRSAIRGGGKKPWRQKGTGRARVGTIRSPLWRGGGVIFGPHPREYSSQLPRKVRKAAIRSALAEKFHENRLIVLAAIELPRIRTKDFVRAMADLGVDQALIVTNRDNINLKLSSRNVKEFKVVSIEGLNLYDLLRFQTLILMQETIPILEQALN